MRYSAHAHTQKYHQSEVELMQRLQHKNLLRVLGLYTSRDGAVWIVQEYCYYRSAADILGLMGGHLTFCER